jgi:type IV pilus assembly protein PilA
MAPHFSTVHRPGGRGFSLIEIAITLTIIGIIAMLATTAAHKYMMSVKVAEARNSLGQIAKDALTKFEKESMNPTQLAPGSSTQVLNGLCASATNTVPPGGVASTPAGKKYQSTGADWDAAKDPNVGFYCLKFVLDQPQYFLYDYTASGTLGVAGDTFTATANGDLNADGITSTISITGAIDNSRLLNLAPNISETMPDE